MASTKLAAESVRAVTFTANERGMSRDVPGPRDELMPVLAGRPASIGDEHLHASRSGPGCSGRSLVEVPWMDPYAVSVNVFGGLEVEQVDRRPDPNLIPVAISFWA